MEAQGPSRDYILGDVQQSLVRSPSFIISSKCPDLDGVGVEDGGRTSRRQEVNPFPLNATLDP